MPVHVEQRLENGRDCPAALNCPVYKRPAPPMTLNTQSNQVFARAHYLAFRTAFLSTFEALNSELENGTAEHRGFLEHVPLTSGCALHVQIDYLLRTWQRMCACKNQIGIVEQCVCYCAAHELARVGEVQDERRLHAAAQGPQPFSSVDSLWLTSKIRSWQITGPVRTNDPLSLRNGHLLSANLDESASAITDGEAKDQLLKIVGEWQVSPGILANGVGLLDQDESQRLGNLLQQHPRLMNL